MLHIMSHITRKPVIWFFDHVRHKSGYTTSEDGMRLEILDLGIRGIYHLQSEFKDTDQLGGNCTDDDAFVFVYAKKQVFS